MPNKTKNLFYLEELNGYSVADDYCDVRGWAVIDADNRNIGKVTNLLVNKEAERVVYLDVEVDKSLIQNGYDAYQVPANEGVHGFVNKEGEDHLIVPIGMVGLDEENKNVLTNEIDYHTFAKAKRFNKENIIDKDYELTSFRHYVGNDSVESIIWNNEFYERKEFNNTLHGKKTDNS